jgi:hypothetical protein
LVAEQTVDVGPDGTVAVEIDTSIAKAIHPDQDHKYTVTAEVVDQSRRTIVGAGEVLVARKPFQVFAWVDRGYYRVDDTIHAHFHAHTLDQKPVKGAGTVDLLKISYEQGKLVETSVRQWVLNTDNQGQASLQIVASEAGQYRLSYKVTDEQKHSIEGGYVSSPSLARASTDRNSASIIWSSFRTNRTMPRARRSACKSIPNNATAPCCCLYGRQTGFICGPG